ncbi:unnamed protein product [Ilex paraguariensis]|uniref:BHLH domain-containing protein n=1 Tax=Ilex paraguariensis TaxID=185542 RepID=A0ABC8RMW4_9AQUA
MQSDQQFSPRKPVVPLTDQVGGGYMHNDPIASIFGKPALPLGAKHSMPFHGVEFQPSEVCPRNFIIFDQTDNRSQIMFHPAIGSKFGYPGLNMGTSYFQDTVERKDASDRRENSSVKEDSDDIDALLSLEEEECDEEEVSTARTYGDSGGDSSDSCSNYCSKPRKSRLPSLKKSSGSGTSCSESKHQKMRKMVKALRVIVPGANQMNTVDVLDEAVRYLKSLKVDVQNLGVGNMN